MGHHWGHRVQLPLHPKGKQGALHGLEPRDLHRPPDLYPGQPRLAARDIHTRPPAAQSHPHVKVLSESSILAYFSELRYSLSFTILSNGISKECCIFNAIEIFLVGYLHRKREKGNYLTEICGISLVIFIPI